MATLVEDAPVVHIKEVCFLFSNEKYSFFSMQDDVIRNLHQNYVLSSQYESLDTDDFYTKYKVKFMFGEKTEFSCFASSFRNFNVNWNF